MAVKSDLPNWDVWLKNRLKGIVPTFAIFGTNPSSPDLMTDGNWTTESGEGVKALAAPGTIGQIFFDMGAIYPVLIIPHINIHRVSGDGTVGMAVSGSLDGVTYTGWVNFITGMTIDIYQMGVSPAFLNARYIRVQAFSSGTSVASVYHVKIAEIMAIQLM